MSKMNVIPAVMMALSAASNPAMSMPATAISEIATATATPDSAMPLVTLFTAKNSVATPARLGDFTIALAKASGHPTPSMIERCETISGCTGGWDDSQQDC